MPVPDTLQFKLARFAATPLLRAPFTKRHVALLDLDNRPIRKPARLQVSKRSLFLFSLKNDFDQLPRLCVGDRFVCLFSFAVFSSCFIPQRKY